MQLVSSDTSLVSVMKDGLEGCVIEYDAVKSEVKKIFGNHDSIEREVAALRSPFHMVYAKTRNKVLGRSPPSVSDLIRLQEGLINGLVSGLSRQLDRTDRTLSAIAEYSDILDDRVAEAVSNRGSMSGDIKKLKEEVDVFRREVETLDRSQPVYYDKRKLLKSKVRKLSSIASGYSLANDSIRDNVTINSNVMLREELLRLSVVHARSLVEASSRYSEFLGVIRGVYADFLRQSKLYGALSNTVRRSREFISALDTITVKGQIQTMRLASRAQNYGLDSNMLLGSSLESMNGLSDDKSDASNDFVESYLRR